MKYKVVVCYLEKSEPEEIDLDPKEIADFDLSGYANTNSWLTDNETHSVLLLDEDDNVISEYLVEG